jgi:hypothetical protein
MIHHLLDALAQGTTTADEAHGRVYGWLPGIVTDVDTKLMQIKARLGKQGDNESTDWIAQAGMGSIESLPEVNDPVGVFFNDGDVHRGAYFCFPQTTSKGRPTQPIPLGTNLVGMYNFLVDQFNQLRTDFNSHSHAVPASGISAPAGGGACTGSATSASPSSPTAALTGNKGKASDGSVVSNNSTSAVALSKRSRVR